MVQILKTDEMDLPWRDLLFRKEGPVPGHSACQPIRGLLDIAELVMLRYREDEEKVEFVDHAKRVSPAPRY